MASKARPIPSNPRTDEELSQILNAFAFYCAVGIPKSGDPASEEWLLVFQEVTWLAEDAPEASWRLIELAYMSDVSDAALLQIGATLLEDVLAYHGEATLARLATEAPSNSRLCLMLSGVWQGFMPDATWKRVEALCRELEVPVR